MFWTAEADTLCFKQITLSHSKCMYIFIGENYSFSQNNWNLEINPAHMHKNKWMDRT